MMIGSEDSRSPLGRPSSLVPQMTLQPLHSMCSGSAVSPPQCFPAGVPTAASLPDSTCVYLFSTMQRCPADGSLTVALTHMWAVPHTQPA